MLSKVKPSIWLGSAAGIITIFLWLTLHFFNPYTDRFEPQAALNTFLMLVLPACTALIAVMTSKHRLLLAAFIWSLPASAYLALTPGIFSWFGATSAAYLIAYFMMRAERTKGRMS